MGGTTTRGRKKAAAAEAEQIVPAEAVAAHDNELQSHVEQLMANLTAAKEERTAFDAEVRQKITEMKNKEPETSSMLYGFLIYSWKE